MKIIKRGDGHSPWQLMIVCDGKGNTSDNANKGLSPCYSTLQIEAQDIFTTNSYHYDGSSDMYYTIKCPCCGCLTDISEKKLPYSVQIYASKRKRPPQYNIEELSR